jgi:hypothetical protein
LWGHACIGGETSYRHKDRQSRFHTCHATANTIAAASAIRSIITCPAVRSNIVALPQSRVSSMAIPERATSGAAVIRANCCRRCERNRDRPSGRGELPDASRARGAARQRALERCIPGRFTPVRLRHAFRDHERAARFPERKISGRAVPAIDQMSPQSNLREIGRLPGASAKAAEPN